MHACCLTRHVWLLFYHVSTGACTHITAALNALYGQRCRTKEQRLRLLQLPAALHQLPWLTDELAGQPSKAATEARIAKLDDGAYGTVLSALTQLAGESVCVYFGEGSRECKGGVFWAVEGSVADALQSCRCRWSTLLCLACV